MGAPARHHGNSVNRWAAISSQGLTRLAGRLLGWLLVCDPEEQQSSEELATALAANGRGSAPMPGC